MSIVAKWLDGTRCHLDGGKPWPRRMTRIVSYIRLMLRANFHPDALATVALENCRLGDHGYLRSSHVTEVTSP